MAHWRDEDDRPWETFRLPHKAKNRDEWDDLLAAITHAVTYLDTPVFGECPDYTLGGEVEDWELEETTFFSPDGHPTFDFTLARSSSSLLSSDDLRLN